MSFLCFLCRRTREVACHRRRMPCCGELVEICEERCAEMFPLSGKMTVEGYGAFYEKIHRIVCKEKFQM